MESSRVEKGPCIVDDSRSLDTLAQQALGLPLNALSENVLQLLGAVLSTHDGKVNEAATWFNSDNNSLDGCSPAFLIRQGQVRRVLDAWKECERQYG